MEEYLMNFEEFMDEMIRVEGMRAETVMAKVLHPGKMSDIEIHADICSDIHTTFIEKNKRYGNSFSNQFSEFGMLSLIIRLSDKLNRLKTLTTASEGMDTLDESIEDSLADMANYAIMGLVELEKLKRGVK